MNSDLKQTFFIVVPEEVTIQTQRSKNAPKENKNGKDFGIV